MKCKTCNAKPIIIFANDDSGIFAKYVCFCGKKKVVEKTERIVTDNIDHHKKSIDVFKKKQIKLKEELKKDLQLVKKKPELVDSIEKTWNKLTVVSTQIAELYKLEEKYQEENLKFPYV